MTGVLFNGGQHEAADAFALPGIVHVETIDMSGFFEFSKADDLLLILHHIHRIPAKPSRPKARRIYSRRPGLDLRWGIIFAIDLMNGVVI